MKPSDSIATTITVSNNSAICMRCLGFSNSFSFGYTSPTVVQAVTSTQQVNLLQNTAIYVRSDNLIQSVNFENIVGKSEVSDILAKIQTNVNPMTMILWTNPSDLEVKINNRIIEYINVYVGDSTQYNLNLGNLDWTMRLTIHEWSPTGSRNDMAINMPESNQELQQLMEQRQAIVNKLADLKEKIKG